MLAMSVNDKNTSVMNKNGSGAIWERFSRDEIHYMYVTYMYEQRCAEKCWSLELYELIYL